ncbi:MAG: hypothetical protein J5965_15820 [Aeriscardovia sp.]|nr:hypothetical protein [Aeriscardovia sp.]
MEVSRSFIENVREAFRYLGEEAGYVVNREAMTDTDVEYCQKGLDAMRKALQEMPQDKEYTVHFNAQFGYDVKVLAENEEEAMELARERMKNSDNSQWEYLQENETSIIDVNVQDNS